jgi:hypothetical protein
MALGKPQASSNALLRLIVPIQAKLEYRSFPPAGVDRLKPADPPHESLKNPKIARVTFVIPGFFNPTAGFFPFHEK